MVKSLGKSPDYSNKSPNPLTLNESLKALQEKLQSKIPRRVTDELRQLVSELATKAQTSDAGLEALHYVAAASTHTLFLLAEKEPQRVAIIAAKFLTWPVKLSYTPASINAAQAFLRKIKLSENPVSSLPAYSAKGRCGGIAKRWIEQAVSKIDAVRIAYCQNRMPPVHEWTAFECHCLGLPELTSKTINQWWAIICWFVMHKTGGHPEKNQALRKLANRAKGYEFESQRRADILTKLKGTLRQMCSSI